MTTTIVTASIVAVFVFGGFLLPQQKKRPRSDANWSNTCRAIRDTCQGLMSESSMMVPGMMGGQGMMGRGMMGGRGMMASGMMGMMGRGMMNRMRMSDYQQSDTKLSQPLDKQGAVGLVEEYIQSLNNPRLEVGNVQEKDDAFLVDVVTKKGNALVEKVKVEKKTGWLSPADNE